jgi:succinate dehydrogenase/fumarate reductase flavoprotein subunit
MPDSEMYDVVVLGAGAGGMTAAAVAAASGLDVLVLEKTGFVGGTTAVSGGMVWVPGNSKAAAIGQPDSIDAARAYLARLVPGTHNEAVREAFLSNAAGAIAWLEAHTSVRLQPVPVYPDYYPDLPGAALGGRVLEPVAFDATRLGAAFALLRPPLPEFTLFGGMMVARPEIAHFRRIGRSWRSARRVAALLARHARERVGHPRGTTLVLGNALAAQLLHTLLRPNVALRTGITSQRLLMADGAVQGVQAEGTDILARRGVVLATGGFSHDPALRGALLPAAAGAFSAAAPGNTGDGLRLGQEAGGVIERRGEGGAFWTPLSRFTRADGSPGAFPHTVTDRAKPGIIAVNRAACRFVNEALSYHEFVRAMLRAGAPPRAFLIADRTALWRYGLGAIRPFTLALGRWRREGYLASAPDVRGLARAIGLPPDALAATVARFNDAAARGEDPEFGRGGDAYQRFMGDPEQTPNPCLRPLDRPPFFAIALDPGDLGTATGLATDGQARVLGADGRPLRGLYACGNDMNSVMNGAYPGPGITLGPALTFGVLAGQSLVNDGRGDGRSVRDAAPA